MPYLQQFDENDFVINLKRHASEKWHHVTDHVAAKMDRCYESNI